MTCIKNTWFKRQPKISINLINQKENHTTAYTTSDRIEGEATVIADHDTDFGHVEITFEGTARVYVQRTGPPHAAPELETKQTFLRLQQHIDESAYSSPRVLRRGQKYTFPFSFIVPDCLNHQSCEHGDDENARHRHAQLPPTLQASKLTSRRKYPVDDMTPTACRISYGVKVAVLKRSSEEMLVNRTKKIRLIPGYDEETPYTACDDIQKCFWRRKKDIQYGMRRDKLGQLIVTAFQPRPLRLSAPECIISENGNSTAVVHIRFNPIGDEAPPCLGTLYSKLRVSTSYSCNPWTDSPSHSIMGYPQTGTRVFAKSFPLSSLCVESVQWTKHTAEDSLINYYDQVATSDTATKNSTTGIFYTASLVVSITLPQTKAFVPTFESCLISRAYALELRLSYHTSNTFLPSSIEVKVPVQIVSAGGTTHEPLLPPYTPCAGSPDKLIV